MKSRKKLMIAMATVLSLLIAFPGTASERQTQPKQKIALTDYSKKATLANWPKSKKTATGANLMSKVNGKRLAPVFNEANSEQAFYGALLYSEDWLSYYEPYGVCAFAATNPMTVSQVFENEDMPQAGGGFFTDKYYYMTTYFEDYFSGALTVNTYVYSTDSWEMVYDVAQPASALATDMAFDPIDNVAYGCFYDNGDVAWGYMDPSTCEVTHISPLEGELIAVAVNAKGEAYAITSGGYLVKVNKKTGELTAIGHTGLSPAYLQSASFSDDGILYWAAVFSYDDSALYTVNLETGAASLVSYFPHNEEIVSLYAMKPVPAAGAPAKAQDLNATFVDDQLNGDVIFTIPTTTYNGDPLTGSVDYVVTVNGEDLATGTSQAGQQVSANVTVPKAGYSYFVVTLSNAEGNAEQATLRQWVGIDEPNPVSNVQLTKTGDKQATITWNAPNAAVHGGYFSADRITYNITRLPDGKVVATGLRATEFVDVVDIDGQALIRYQVTAVADDVEGAPVTSNGVVFGDAYPVPVHFSFDTEEEFNIFTIIDNNETPALDSGCWLYSPSGQVAGYNTGTKDGDDWLITPAIALKADRQYTFQYDVCCYSDYWPDEYAVYMGNAATAEGMTAELLPTTTIYWDEMRTMTFTVTVPEDGNYYFGFYATSEAGGAFFLIDDIQVTEGLVLKAPAQVENLTVTAGENGALNATVAFNAPVSDVAGDAVESITAINITRDGEVVKTFESPQPGEALTFTENGQETGMATYEVVCINNYGEGPVATGQAWVGVDYPSAPLNVKVSLNDEGHPVISWNQPEGRGVHGGYVDNNSVTYTVYQTANGRWVATDFTGNNYVDEEITLQDAGDQSMIEYAVFAESATGLGYPATAFMIYGDNYTLPFEESFADSTPSHFWGFWGTNGEGWKIGDDWSYYSQDDDDGLLAYLPSVPGSQVMAFSGKISMNGAVNPVLSFYLNKMSYDDNGFAETDPKDDELYVQVAADGFDLQTIKTIRMEDITKSGYIKYEVPLNDFINNEFIIISFLENAVSDRTPIMLDNIKIENRLSDNLALVNVTAPASATVNEEIVISATVKNTGANDEVYSVELYRGEELEQTIENLTLESGQNANVNFTVTALPAWGDSETFTVKIVCGADQDASDDEAEPFTIEIIHPYLPAPTDLDYTTDGDVTTFTWVAPEGLDGGNEIVTDDFESYKNGDLTYGDWICQDKAWFGDYGVIDIELDGYEIYIPHNTETQAFMVYNPASCFIDLDEYPEWQPHSGNKMIVSFADYANDFGYENDDWLISPELSGDEQTISFYARTASTSKRNDYIQVRYSTTGTATSDFTLLPDGEIRLENGWTRYEYTLPAGTRYFAIRNNSEEGFAVLLDDITYTIAGDAPQVTLLGYDIYCDGELLNDEPISETTFTIDGAAPGNYWVTAVYDAGESEASNTVIIEKQVTAIDEISSADDASRIYYDLQGRRVYTLQSGQIYICNGKKILYMNR